MAFLKFMIGGMLVLFPFAIMVLIVGEILSQSPRARVFAIIAIAFAGMIVGGTELIISATKNRS